MAFTPSSLIRIRRGTEAQWILSNPILADGEPGYVRGTALYKIGDGSTRWNDLQYVTGIKGDKGDRGETGARLDYKGKVTDSSQLPTTGNSIGDMYIVETPAPETTWIFGSEGWQQAGNAGVPGPPGEHWFGTQFEYDLIVSKNPFTLYCITSG